MRSLGGINSIKVLNTNATFFVKQPEGVQEVHESDGEEVHESGTTTFQGDA